MKLRRYTLYSLIAVFCLWLILPVSCTLPSPASTSSSHSEENEVFPEFADVVAKVAPSVVAISTETVTYDSYNNPHTEEGAGSGWIVDESGTIVTNNHVVDGAKTITVEFSDHKAFTATNITTDPTSDIATLKVNRGTKVQPLTIADSSLLRVGDWVMVMGNPLGMGISAKQGIVSRLGVTMSSSPEQTYNNLIETSAAINPGNSGGPMVNLNGEVIGITSLKISASGIEGMGYAITIHDVVPIIQVLATGQPFLRPWLGASLASVDNGVAVLYQLPTQTGALIVSLSQGSPLFKARMEKGEIIVGFDDTSVDTADQLNQLVNSSKVGQKVKLTFWQGKDKKTAEIILVAGPPPSTKTPGATPPPT